MIEIKNLVKNYGKHNVLNIKDFIFLDGRSYLLVGSNGSGKSTLIKCILGINKINSGHIYLNTKNIGYVPEKCYYPEFSTVETFLKSIISLYDSKYKVNIDYYCDIFKLDKSLKISKLSKGMMQKVLIIQSLIHNADLYIFDEPLNGLDKTMQNIFFTEITKLKNQNKTVIITTHYPDFYINKYDYTLRLIDGDIKIESN